MDARRRIKRGMDVAAAAAGLVVGAPVLLGVGAAVWASLGRPVLFCQPRAGEGGRVFRLWKFRTMREPRRGEDRYASDAARVTRVGRFLRATSLDELPTLLNVLRGDMSLVGPRPLLVEYLERYTPEQARRHEVRPGVTGLAQVRGRTRLPWEERFALDVWYVDHWSLGLDARILAQTALRMLAPDGETHAGGSTPPLFQGEPAPAREGIAR